jgi:transcription termination factor Rho
VGWLRRIFGGGKKGRAPAVDVPPRSELETRPLADLHLYAAKLGVERYRLLRKQALVTTLLERSGQDSGPVASNGAVAEAPPAPAERAPAERPKRTREERPERPAREPKRTREPRPEPEAKPEPDDEPTPAIELEGVLDITRRGHGFLRTDGLARSRDDAYVSRAQIRRLELRSGDRLSVQARPARRSERYPSVARVETVNGDAAGTERGTSFEEQQPAPAKRVFPVPTGDDNVTARMVDLVAPIGPGQAVLISSQADAGATAVLLDIGRALVDEANVELTVVALDVDPGAKGDWDMAAAAAVEISAAGQSPGSHVGIAQLAVERAKRSAEAGTDAVVLLDSITALADADAQARRRRSGADDDSEQAGSELATRLFSSARDIENGGSLTMIVVSSDEGPVHSALAEVADAEIALDAALASDGLEPAIDLTRSRAAEQNQRRAALRSVINTLEPREAWEFLSEKLSETASNEALLEA